MKKYLFASLLALSLPAAALAADTSPAQPAKPQDAALERARTAIAQKDWIAAQAVLRDAVARDSSNADYHNLYAYSIRKGQNPAMDLVFRHYNEALRIDPKHRAAHEYLGEAYLMTGNVPKAKELLAQLDNLCAFGCEEFTKLKKEVAVYEQLHAKH